MILCYSDLSVTDGRIIKQLIPAHSAGLAVVNIAHSGS